MQTSSKAKRYAYHNDVTWIKDEKRSHQKRTLIGRISPETGEIIPTTGNRRKNQIDENVIQEEISAYGLMENEYMGNVQAQITAEDLLSPNY